VGLAPSIRAPSKEPPRRFKPRSPNEPLLILAALGERLHRARRALREATSTPITILFDPPLGRGGAIVALTPICRTGKLSVIALIGIHFLLIGIVKKTGS